MSENSIPCKMCGRKFQPDDTKAYSIAELGPECFKKYIRGEITIDDLREAGIDQFGDVPNIGEFLLPNGVKVSQYTHAKNLDKLVFASAIGRSMDDLIIIREVYGTLQFSLAASTTNLQNIKEHAEFLPKFLSIKGDELALPASKESLKFQLSKIAYESLFGEYKPHKVLRDYDSEAFDPGAKLAYQLAKIGISGSEQEAGFKALAIQKFLDEMTLGRDNDDEFMRMLAYFNSEETDEAQNNYPQKDTVKNMLLTSAYLDTSSKIDVERNAKTISDLLPKIASSEDAEIIKNEILKKLQYEEGSDTRYSQHDSSVTMKDIDDFKFETCADVGKTHLDMDFFAVTMSESSRWTMTSQYRNSDNIDKIVDACVKMKKTPTNASQEPGFRLPDINLERTDSDMPKVKNREARNLTTSFNELALNLQGKKRMDQASVAALALCPSKDSEALAVVVEMEDGFIKNMKVAKNPLSPEKRGMIPSHIAAHMALKDTFWKSDDFLEESVAKKREYFIATPTRKTREEDFLIKKGKSEDDRDYYTSSVYHFEMEAADKNSVLDCKDMVPEGGAVYSGRMTATWSTGVSLLNYKKGLVRNRAIEFNENQSSSIVVEPSDSAKVAMIESPIVGPRILREIKGGRSVSETLNMAANGKFGISGSVMMCHVEALREEFENNEKVSRLLEDAETTSFGLSSLADNHDLRRYYYGDGRAVAFKVAPNPDFDEVEHKSLMSEVFETVDEE